MNSYDIFQPAKPMKGAVIRDWTNQIITVDLVNGIGERFHFEVDPDPDPIRIPRGGDTSWGGKCQLDITLPIVAEQ